MHTSPIAEPQAKAEITSADRNLAISLVRLYMDMAREGREGISSVPTASKVNQLIAEHRVASVAPFRSLAILCNAYLEPIADQLEFCHKQPHEAKALRQLLAEARALLGK